MEIEQITCKCGAVIAGCVVGEETSEWEIRVLEYLNAGYTSSTVDVAYFEFGKCMCAEEPTIVLEYPKALRFRKTGEWVVMGEQDGEYYTLTAPYPDLFPPEYTQGHMVDRFGSDLMDWGRLELVTVKIEVV
jgi:hypothetical protein